MMNAKRSSKITLTRYALLVPVVVVSLCAFSLSKAEAVKSSPAFKAVSDVVENINNAVLNHDTVPTTTRTITGTVSFKKGVNGTTKTITLKGADVDNLTFTIDSPRIQRQTVTVTGKRPGQKDSVITFTIADKPMGSFNSNFSSAQTFNSDSTTFRRNSMLKGLTTYEYRATSDGIIYVAVPDKAMTETTKSFTFKGDTLRNIKLNSNLAFMNNATPFYYRFEKSTSTTGSNNTDKNKEVIVQGKPMPSNGTYRVVTTDPNGNQIDPAQPLFIVDGKEVNQKDLKSFEGVINYLDPKAAAKVYGSRGKNGVLIMTTRKKLIGD